MNFSSLKGQRIDLVELSLSGLDDMFEYSRKPEFYRYLEFPPQQDKQETLRYLERLIARSNVETAYYWFIKHTTDNKIIGTIGIHDIDWRKLSGEVSYGISPDYWGKGYFQEALRLILDYVFEKKGFYRVCATTWATNTPSIKSLQKLGFKDEGVLRGYYLDYKGQRHDATILAVLRNEYKQV
jgi:ribosomal-protein-alanine N-acetyltransferase